MAGSPIERQLAMIAVLADPVRRRLYLHVMGQSGDVSRDQAARAIGISRPAAAFHLEKLVERDLLEARYRRLSGRTGPGAGRPARVYWRPRREVHVDIPSRDYELVARFLLSGLDPTHPGKASERAHEAARKFGAELGAEARRRAGSRAGHDRVLTALGSVLEDRGFEPQRADAQLRLRNCPFNALSTDYRELVCPLNLSMMQGALEKLRAPKLEAVLDQKPDQCCVAFRPTTRSRTRLRGVPARPANAR